MHTKFAIYLDTHNLIPTRNLIFVQGIFNTDSYYQRSYIARNNTVCVNTYSTWLHDITFQTLHRIAGRAKYK